MAVRFKHKGIFVLMFFLMIAAVGAQLMHMRNIREGDVTSAARPIALAQQVPSELAGWTVQDQKLGASEFMQSAVERTLNYDDYVYRSYSRGAVEFSLYIGYWSAGRMPVSKVASHTPDRCWSENGWNCEAMRFNEVLSAGDLTLPPGQWRRFKPPVGPEQYVIYWHLVGDELYDYGERFNRNPHPFKWWRDSFNYALRGSQPQYFIRITSKVPVESLEQEEGFREVLRQLVRLGLKPGLRPGLSI